MINQTVDVGSGIDFSKYSPRDMVKIVPLAMSGRETVLPGEQLVRVSDAMEKGGKQELADYSPIDALRKKKKGIGVIVIDCAKVDPQQSFAKLAKDRRQEEGNQALTSPDFYEERAYTMGITLEALGQMLDYTKNKPKTRPEDKEVTAHLELLYDKIGGYGRVNSDIAGDTTNLICSKLDLLAKSLKLQKFVVVLTNTQSIPEHSKQTVGNMLNRGFGENATGAIFLSKAEATTK